MKVSYEKLFLYFFKNNINSNMVSKKSGVTRNTITKMKKNEPVHLNAILAICDAYDLNVTDVVEFIKEREEQ